MEFEWSFFRLLFGQKRQRRRFEGYGEERRIPSCVADYLTCSVRRASGFVVCWACSVT